MKHLIRAAVLLIVIMILAFVLPRLIPFTKSEELQSLGFYAGKDNSEEWKQLPVQYADPITCNECHADKHDAWSNSSHKTVSCENCHGPAEQHIETGLKLAVDTSPSLCEPCHSKVLARPGDFPQVDFKEHGRQINCTNCHNPHDPGLPMVLHNVQGYDDCALCHSLNPLPATHKERTVDTCLGCHSNQEGS